MKAFISRHRVVLGTALLAMLMMAGVYALLGVWPFGGSTVLTGDLNSQYIAYFSHFQRWAQGEAGFAYGFDKGLGGGLIGLVAYYVTSPFNLLYLIVPTRWFPAVAGFNLYAKIVLACVFFSIFIHKKYPQLSFSAVPLSLCYGFCTYAFVYAQNIMWHDVLVLLPLICLGIDQILAGRRPILYTIALALAIFANFYIAFMACIFAVIYFLWSILCGGQHKSAAYWRQSLLRFIPASLLAAGLNAALLLPTLADVGQSKGGLLAYTFSTQTNFSLLQLRERLVWGNFVVEDQNGGLPFIYCGALALLLLVCYFASKIRLREKLLSAGVLLLFVLSFWSQGLDDLWHGLKSPVYFPARYAFLFCFFVLLLAACALARGTIGTKQLVIGSGVLAVIYALAFIFPVTTSRARIVLTLAAVVLYALCLWLAAPAQGKRRKPARLAAPAAIVLVLATAAEMSLGGYFVTNKLEKYPLEAYQNFVDTNGAAIDAIQTADTGSYRIADSWFRSLNDAMLLGYKGLSHFGSTLDDASQDILYSLGYRAYGGTGPYLSGSTAFADSLLALRYRAGDDALSPRPSHWQSTEISTTLPVYQNPTALPMAFAASINFGALDGMDARAENSFEYQNALYQALGGEGKLFTSVPVQVDTLYISGTTLQMTARADGPHYALFKGAYADDARLIINGKDCGEYFTPLRMGIISLGHLSAGDTVELAFSTSADIPLDYAYFYRMDADKLESFTGSILAQSSSFTVADGYASGNVTVQAGQMLFTSIPWGDVWSATVNGQPVQPQQLGNFLCLPLQAGENTVTLLHHTPGTGIPSWGTSAVCLLFAFGYLIFVFINKRKTALKETPHANPDADR